MNSQYGDQTRRSARPHENLQPSLSNDRPRAATPRTGAVSSTRPAARQARPLEPSLSNERPQTARPVGTTSTTPRTTASAPRTTASAPRPASTGARTTSAAQPRTAAPRAAANAQTRTGAYQSRPAETRTASGEARQARPAQSRPTAQSRAMTPHSAPRKSAPKKKTFRFEGAKRVFATVTKPLDVFRKGEASTIIVNSLVGALALVIVLALLVMAGPGLRMTRAKSLASSGQAEAATKLLDALAEDGYSPQKIASARRALVEQLIRRERYDEALAYAAQLDAGEAEELILRARYGQAASLYEKGDYAAAAQAFYQLGDYEDSASRYDDSRCALAVSSFLAGDEGTARQLLQSVKDADQRIAAAALKASGSQEQARTLLSLELFNPDNLAAMERTMEELSAARASAPLGRIAAGRRHTLGLRADGMVLAAGDNSYGQCDVGGWTEILQIAAGAYHSVGLRVDGTVVAAGDNSEGQCDVGGWTNITAVACTSYGTLGLKDDGTVVMCGKGSDAVSGWHGATMIAGGSYSAGCLYEQGSMLCTHKGAQMDMGVALYDLSVCGTVSAGVKSDGALISTYDRAPAWTELVSVTATETGLLGVTGDGRALMYTFHTREDTVLPVDGMAVEAEGSGTHTVVLTADGRVFAFGLNDAGQCDVSGWRL